MGGGTGLPEDEEREGVNRLKPGWPQSVLYTCHVPGRERVPDLGLHRAHASKGDRLQVSRRTKSPQK